MTLNGQFSPEQFQIGAGLAPKQAETRRSPPSFPDREYQDVNCISTHGAHCKDTWRQLLRDLACHQFFIKIAFMMILNCQFSPKQFQIAAGLAMKWAKTVVRHHFLIVKSHSWSWLSFRAMHFRWVSHPAVLSNSENSFRCKLPRCVSKWQNLRELQV